MNGQDASWTVKVQAEVSNHKLKYQSADVRLENHSPSTFKGQNASWMFKTRVERWKRELNGQNMMSFNSSAICDSVIQKLRHKKYELFIAYFSFALWSTTQKQWKKTIQKILFLILGFKATSKFNYRQTDRRKFVMGIKRCLTVITDK